LNRLHSLNKVRKTLNKAADLIEEKDWCKDTYARDADGNAVSEYSPSAVRFCMLGAIAKVSVGESREFIAAIQHFEKTTKCLSVTLYNDANCTSKTDAIKALRSAAEKTGYRWIDWALGERMNETS